MTQYLLIRADEGGNPLKWLDQRALRELLADPQEYAGVRVFLEDVPIGLTRDPNYWNQGQGLLLKVEVVVPVPSGAYQLPEGD